ncbi:Peptidase family M48 [Catalinimonas alkaloidigena]|uniref:Peptidase family M48 n=1 Tax=Catalinimonas alkaloidigena TaxID=1075417 RepID=A0A1G9URP0_9BACT|nr:M48 family metallopeptidase [Catalinimonas alkaloidigena]SDM62560.1 Peptidase family M48 [Catalinimonas alkaloidigena]
MATPAVQARITRFIIALVVAVISLIGYYSTTQYNPVTEEKQHVNMTAQQEIAMGLQAVPQMTQQYGGLYPDQQAQALVDQVGNKIVQSTAARDTPYEFEFHLLADEQTVNAFALPGGQVFITAALMKQFSTEDQLAGVLGHEIGHVVARHSAEHIAKARLTQGLTGAAVIASYDPSRPSTMRTAAVAAMIGQLVNMKYGRDDELESDRLGVRFMAESGYDPNAMIQVMEILAKSAGGARQPEFFSTHPNPQNRIAQIREAIQEYGYTLNQ